MHARFRVRGDRCVTTIAIAHGAGCIPLAVAICVVAIHGRVVVVIASGPLPTDETCALAPAREQPAHTLVRHREKELLRVPVRLDQVQPSRLGREEQLRARCQMARELLERQLRSGKAGEGETHDLLATVFTHGRQGVVAFRLVLGSGAGVDEPFHT
jgi:hypothetical protein